MTHEYRSTSITINPDHVHTWLRPVKVAYVPGYSTLLLDEFVKELLRQLRLSGHTILPAPQEGMDVLLTTSPFNEPISWRDALGLTARIRFNLERTPMVFNILQASPDQLDALLDLFAMALKKDPPDPNDYKFPGLTPMAYHTLHEQGSRGGPILALLRLVQSQVKCVRNILVIGEEDLIEAYVFDLVGSHPCINAADRHLFYEDLALRIITAASTNEITEHQVAGEPIPLEIWRALKTPAEMCNAGRELGKRYFFTEMVRVANLVSVPALNDAVSSQYSEGCYATWDAQINSLIATVTGSARPVEKDRLSEDELAIIVGVRPDRRGAIIRYVDGKRNDPPSSEAVEMMEMDSSLPRIRLESTWNIDAEVPVIRSKLHGHRGVKAFDPRWVEHVPLDIPYYYYPVSCATDAQAKAIKTAFTRSKALIDPGDARKVVFTVLPGHGTVIIEKWVAGKAPFQVIWEYMDMGYLEIDKLVPQGPFTFLLSRDGKMVVNDPSR
jgi:hypothetical protein